MPQTVKAVAVIPGERGARLVERPAPEITEPTQVRLRVLEVGVGAADRRLCASDPLALPPGSDSLVIGHEALAEVLEVGADVAKLQSGDLVVPTVRRPCDSDGCIPCRSGRADFCSSGGFGECGIRNRDGFMTEILVEEEADLVPVPAALYPVAVLVESATLGSHVQMQFLDIQERLPWACRHGEIEPPGHCHRAAVLGDGPSGLLAAMGFVCAGFDTWVGAQGGETGGLAERAHSFGARAQDAADPPHDLDILLETEGQLTEALTLMPALGRNGVLVLTAGDGPSPPGLSAGQLRELVERNQMILGSSGAGTEAFALAVWDLGMFVQRWPRVVSSLIGRRRPPEELAELLADAPRLGTKDIVSFAVPPDPSLVEVEV